MMKFLAIWLQKVLSMIHRIYYTKTAGESSEVMRVPLNNRAKTLIPISVIPD